MRAALATVALALTAFIASAGIAALDVSLPVRVLLTVAIVTVAAGVWARSLRHTP